MVWRVVVGVVLCLVGVVWIGQGLDVIKGSFMTGHGVWAVFGVLLILFALALFTGARRIRRDAGR